MSNEQFEPLRWAFPQNDDRDLLADREDRLIEAWRKLRLYEQALDVACAEIARLKLENGTARAELTGDDLKLLQEMKIRW